MKHIVHLGLGSNVGDRLTHLQAAISALPPEVEFLNASPIYETAPWGFENQQNFLNQVVEAQTDLEPNELLDYLKDIESQMGRIKTFRNGPREIDIDILLYDNLILETESLIIPHPRLAERAFVLVPLVDLNPNITHPISKQTATELLASLNQDGVWAYQE